MFNCDDQKKEEGRKVVPFFFHSKINSKNVFPDFMNRIVLVIYYRDPLVMSRSQYFFFKAIVYKNSIP